MSLKGKSNQGELPIKAQSNPTPVTGYFVNGESHRSVSIDSLTPNKGKNMNSGTGKKPPSKPSTKPTKSPSKGYKSNPDGDASSGFTVKIKESMQNIKDFAKSLEPAKRGRKQGRIAEAAQETLSSTEKFLKKTASLAGGNAEKMAKEVQAYTEDLKSFMKKSIAAAKDTPEKQLAECKEQLKSCDSGSSVEGVGKSTGSKDVDGLVLKIGDSVIRSDDARYRNNYGTVIGVAKNERVIVRWSDKAITNHKAHQSLRRAAPYKSNPNSAWGEMFKQVGAGLGSFSLAGLMHAGLRALFDKFAPQMIQNYEGIVDTGISLVSIGGTGAIALHPKLEQVRPGFWSFLALRFINHAGRHLPKNLPPAYPQLLGAGATSTLDGLIDLDGVLGGSEVVVDVFDPSGHLPLPRPSRRSLAPQDWERRALL
ncbi:hypothetical protein L6R29_18360 [Myxococcota bacterium]|nr:hypothetical protein [Myxococcota bacterium]